jgi:hypothetical protein
MFQRDRTFRGAVGALVILGALAGATQTASGAGPTLRACGNTESGGVLIGDITTKRVTCATARQIARDAVKACGTRSSCRVRTYTCLVGRAAPELSLARCARAQSGSELYNVVRFDFGS